MLFAEVKCIEGVLMYRYRLLREFLFQKPEECCIITESGAQDDYVSF